MWMWKGRERKSGGYELCWCSAVQHSSVHNVCIYCVNSGCYSSDARGMLYRNRIGIRVKALFRFSLRLPPNARGVSRHQVLLCCTVLYLSNFIRVCFIMHWMREHKKVLISWVNAGALGDACACLLYRHGAPYSTLCVYSSMHICMLCMYGWVRNTVARASRKTAE